MNMTGIIGFALIAAVLALLLRQHRAEFAVIVTVLAGAGILLMTVSALLPTLELMRRLGEEAKLDGQHVGILLKALGICYLSQLAADACRDAGETALAGKVELAGRAAMVVLALPLFTQVLDIVRMLIAGGSY